VRVKQAFFLIFYIVHMIVTNCKAPFLQVYSDKKEQDIGTKPSDSSQKGFTLWKMV